MIYVAIPVFVRLMKETMNERLAQARAEAGYKTPTDAIKRFGWKASTYYAHENKQNRFNPEIAKKYADKYGVNVGWLLTGEGPKKPENSEVLLNKKFSQKKLDVNVSEVLPYIPILGKVAAGSWMEAIVFKRFDNEDAPASVFPPDPRYPIKSQFDLIVEGTSINLFAQDGDMIRCVNLRQAGIEIRNGDLVVVERSNKSGMKETTAKRVRRKDSTFELWPESDDPRWQEPLIVKNDGSNQRDEVRIIAKVLWKYRPA